MKYLGGSYKTGPDQKNIAAPLELQTLALLWSYKHWRSSGATNIGALLELQTLALLWSYENMG